MTVPPRQVRATYDDRTITVYQAYPSQIAEPALAAQRFVPPFKPDRMTWIKPSFLWMMYRCGWATKAGQERVLAVRITREGFESALAQARLSHYGEPASRTSKLNDRDLHSDQTAWPRELRASRVRVQWDPERSLHLAQLPHRSLQVGLSGEAAHRYVHEWTVAIVDVTALAQRIHGLVRERDDEAASALLPAQRPYPLPPAVAATINASDG